MTLPDLIGYTFAIIGIALVYREGHKRGARVGREEGRKAGLIQAAQAIREDTGPVYWVHPHALNTEDLSHPTDDPDERDVPVITRRDFRRS